MANNAKRIDVSTLMSATKTAEGMQYKLTESHRKDAVKAANDLEGLIVDVTPLAINLWILFKIFVTPRGVNLSQEERKITGSSSMTMLQFFHLYDPTIPVQYPKVGSAERKALNGHTVLNRLRYLCDKVGRVAYGDGPKKRDPQVAKNQMKAELKTFGKFCKDFKLSSNAVQVLIKTILKMKTKDGKDFTAKGKKYMKAAGVAVADDE